MSDENKKRLARRTATTTRSLTARRYQRSETPIRRMTRLLVASFEGEERRRVAAAAAASAAVAVANCRDRLTVGERAIETGVADFRENGVLNGNCGDASDDETKLFDCVGEIDGDGEFHVRSIVIAIDGRQFDVSTSALG